MRDAKAIIAEIRDIIETSSSYYSSEPLCTENADDRCLFDKPVNMICE